MNARDDMMPKALKLADMLWQRTEGNPADRARDNAGAKNAAARGNSAAARRAQTPMGEFIPDQAAPAKQDAQARSTAPKSFIDRVKESQAKLTGKGHTFFKQPGNRVDQGGNRVDQNGNKAAQTGNRPDQSLNRVDRGGKRSAEAGNDSQIDREAARSGKPNSAEGCGDEAAQDQDMAVRNGSNPDRAAATKGAGNGRKDGKDSDEAGETEAQAWTPGESRPIGLEGVDSDSLQAGLEGGWEGSAEDSLIDYDALQSRLEELGLAASPEQLRDPAFLAEMLWMIDGIPMAMPVTGESLHNAQLLDVDTLLSPAPAAEGLATEGAMDPAAAALGAGADLLETAVPPTGDAATATGAAAAASAPAAAAPLAAEDFDWTAVEEPAREEIAALIREKLGALSDKPAFRAAPGADLASAAAADGVSVSARSAIPGTSLPLEALASRADLALSDPDRLRVLQTAGLEALSGLGAFPAPETNALRIEGDESGPLPESSEEDLSYLASALPSSDKDEEKEDGDTLPDLMGRNQGQAAARDAAAPRDGSPARDAGPATFHSAMDTARASEARLVHQAKAPALHYGPSGTEQAVLAQIARKMSALGARSTEEIRIQLEPENLGKVRIALDLRDGGMNARISVENDSVRQIVDANLAGLKESLESQGIKLQGLEVSVEHRHASLFNPDGSNARGFFQQRGNGGADSGAEAAQDDSGESDTGRRLGYNTMEYIA